MKKRLIIPMIGAAVGIGYLSMRKDKGEKTTMMDTLANAGMPDQISNDEQEIDQFENAKMVSEGSQFGVQYYNRTVDEGLDDLDERIEN